MKALGNSTAFGLQRAVLALVSIILCTTFSRAQNDSVWTIQSSYRPSDQIGTFISSSNGDTVSLAYSALVNTTKEGVSTTHIQIRNWNANSGKALQNRDYFNVQMADVQPLFRYGTMHGIPHFMYLPNVNTINLVDVTSGALKIDFSVDDTIRNIYMSPDFTHSVICTKNDLYYIVDLEHKDVILRDSVWPSYNYVTPPVPPILPDSSHFLAHFKVYCNPNSWSADNSMVLLRVDRLSDTVETGLQFRGESYWRAFDLSKKQYVSDTIPIYAFGTWFPNSKQFCTYNNYNFYYTDIHSIKKTIHNASPLVDYGLNSADSLVVLVCPDPQFDFWSLSGTKIRTFKPGDLSAYCFSSDAQYLAYLTPDNTLTVVSTGTFQGIYQIHLKFNPDAYFTDRLSIKFAPGNRAILVRDSSQDYRIVDLATNNTVATISDQTYYSTSPDGTSLFIIDTKLHRYNLFTGLLVNSFPDDELSDRLRSFGISPDGNRVLTVDHALRYWDIKNVSQLITREMPTAQQVLWSPVDSIVAVTQLSADSTHRWLSLLNAPLLTTIADFDPSQRFMSFAPDSSSVLLAGSNNTLRRYALDNAAMIDSLHMQSPVTAAIWLPFQRKYFLGDTIGDIWSVSANHDTVVKIFHSIYPIRQFVVSPNGLYLSYISAKDNALIQLSNAKVVSTLSTAPLETLFSEHDSTCTFVYNYSFIREDTRTAIVTQNQTANRAFFRPQKNYYLVGSPDARDSLKLFMSSNNQLASRLAQTPTYNQILWNKNADAVAILDIFNNVTVWKPSNLVEGEGTDHPSDVPEYVSDPNALVYPVPANNSLHIRLENAQSRCLKASVYSLVGSSQSLASSEENTFSVSGLADGVYTLVLSLSDGSTKATRIVVAHGS